MSAFSDLVDSNLRDAQRSMRGRRTDTRVHKAAAKPVPPQLDTPQGLGNTPPAQQAHDMYEGIDLTSPNMMNQMYQRYGPAFIHAAVRKESSKNLKTAAAHPDLHPRVRVLLHAAAAVRKAFEGANPTPAGPVEFGPSFPSVSIPSRPSHGQPGNPIIGYPATVGLRSNQAPLARPNPGAITQEPQTAGNASRAAGSATNVTVGRQWMYDPARGNPVAMPADKTPGGTGDNDQAYNDSHAGRFLGQPQRGDLINFRGPGGMMLQAKLVEVTTGHAIGEFDGQTVQYPLDRVFPHTIGGADHATDDSTPSGLAATRAGSGVGVGAKNDASEFKPTAGSSNVKKTQRDAIYNGNQDMGANTGAGAKLVSPDDNAPRTPYTSQAPYDPEAGQRDGAAPGNHVQGFLTARERALIEQVVSHRGPMPTETAALKALSAGDATDQHKAVLKRAIAAHGFAVPARRADLNRINSKL